MTDLIRFNSVFSDSMTVYGLLCKIRAGTISSSDFIIHMISSDCSSFSTKRIRIQVKHDGTGWLYDMTPEEEYIDCKIYKVDEYICVYVRARINKASLECDFVKSTNPNMLILKRYSDLVALPEDGKAQKIIKYPLEIDAPVAIKSKITTPTGFRVIYGTSIKANGKQLEGALVISTSASQINFAEETLVCTLPVGPVVISNECLFVECIGAYLDTSKTYKICRARIYSNGNVQVFGIGEDIATYSAIIVIPVNFRVSGWARYALYNTQD